MPVSLSYLTGGGPRRRGKTPVTGVLEFIPQAILRTDILLLSKQMDVPVTVDCDDLDKFRGMSFISENAEIPISIRHYAGHPAETVTLYLPYEIQDIDYITEIISKIIEELHLTQDAIYWQRKDDPEL